MSSRSKSSPPDDAVGAVFPMKEGAAPNADEEVAIAAAEDAVRQQAADYVERLRADLETVRKAFDAALVAPETRLADIDHIYAVLHNTKGQAESFGYALVTQICALACGILQRNRNPDEGVLRAVKAHVDALDIVASHNLAGDGGDLGQQMVSTLEGLAAAAG